MTAASRVGGPHNLVSGQLSVTEPAPSEPASRLKQFFTESLILAQDERWRRA